MIEDFLNPIEDSVVAHLLLHSQFCLGNTIKFHSSKEGFPELKNVDIAIFGVQEDRNSENNFGCGDNLQFIRKKLYQQN